MDRRKSLKLIATGAVAVPAALAGCNTPDSKAKTETPAADSSFTIDRNPDELKYEKELLAKEKFFTDHEMATITVLGDIIIPRDEISGSASDAKVPAFIEFIVHDMPSHQVPLKGGLRWLDMHSLNKHGKSFIQTSSAEQLAIIDQIAYPNKASADLKPGVAFFTLMRNLVATGFYTSEIGVKDIGYVGNQPTQWNGVPDDVLKQYKVAYTEKELKECVSFNPA